jgi:hypothetical protein
MYELILRSYWEYENKQKIFWDLKSPSSDFKNKQYSTLLSTVKPFQTIAQLPLNRSRELNGTALHNYLQDMIDGSKVLRLTILLMGLWKLMIPSGILGVK